jgi:hypothetical protein
VNRKVSSGENIMLQMEQEKLFISKYLKQRQNGIATIRPKTIASKIVAGISYPGIFLFFLNVVLLIIVLFSDYLR